jgi:ATP-binding cassette subfamily C protein
LLLGFEKPTSGIIYYDDSDLATLNVKSVRKQFGVVLQDGQVSANTIYKNIVGSSSLSMDDAWEAAEMSGIAEDIREMPMGMHTVVSAGGGAFSGGQRQRLLVARALVHKPSIIFFDEATSALDNKTQKIISNSLDRIPATKIVVAHRLSTIINADTIYLLENGQINEKGTYDELMRRKGSFYELAKRQLTGEE